MPSTNPPPTLQSSWSFFSVTLTILVPILAIALVFQLDSFDPVPMPIHELTQPRLKAAKTNSQILKGDVEFLWKGQLKGPEDLVLDSKTGLIYMSCEDGWVKRVRVNDSVVEDWVNTGGRPLGIALGKNNDVIIADAYKGLLRINEEGRTEVLTDEAEGVKFKLTDAVDIAEDGTIYFTDASHKYDVSKAIWDIMEGRPNGRLLSFDPLTYKTKVLVHNLYFANGVSLSPLQDFLVFCETSMRRCRKYHIQGNKKGQIEDFLNLPGPPDNIHYDPNGRFWIIGLSPGSTLFWDIAYRYPMVRKFMGILMKFTGLIFSLFSNGGVFLADLDGNPIAHYYDPRLNLVTGGLKIDNHLYIGSLVIDHILRLNLDTE